MKRVPFDPKKDIPPIPFERKHLQLAFEMKECGLIFKPHVGCFVWDVHEYIKVASPFPLRVYFILSITRFIGVFGTLEALAEKLVWVPTWHQARWLAGSLGITQEDVLDLFSREAVSQPGDELLGLYQLILRALGSQ